MEDAWSRLFKFPCWCLARLSHGGQRHSLAIAVNRQLQEEADKSVPQLGRQRVVRLLCRSDHLLVKLDFKNAFNSLRRDCMISAVQQFIPDILSLVHSAYASSLLFCGDHTFLSAEGVQQGNPLGLLLLCHHPISDL